MTLETAGSTPAIYPIFFLVKNFNNINIKLSKSFFKETILTNLYTKKSSLYYIFTNFFFKPFFKLFFLIPSFFLKNKNDYTKFIFIFNIFFYKFNYAAIKLFYSSFYWVSYWALTFFKNQARITTLNTTVLCAYYSSFLKNQRFFFFFKSIFNSSFISIGTVLKSLNILTKGLRNTTKGFLLFLKATQVLISFFFNKPFFAFKNLKPFSFFFFTGFSKKFFFFISKLLSTTLFFNKTDSLFIFLPKISFCLNKIKKFKAIKRSYRKRFISLEKYFLV